MSTRRRICTGVVSGVIATTSVILIPATGASAAGLTDSATTVCTPEPGYANCIRYSYKETAHYLTVPAGVTSLRVKLWAAGGGGVEPYPESQISGGGSGGFTEATLAVTPGSPLALVVGEGGHQAGSSATYGDGGGGGSALNESLLSAGASGGGLSGVFAGQGDEAINAPLLIAGGGGGAGGAAGRPDNSDNPIPSGGGGGGGLTGTSTAASAYYGGPGTPVAGGAAGATADAGCVNTATAGSSFRGGTGGNTNSLPNGDLGAGGGGGGGYFGGGGGACLFDDLDNPHSSDFGGPGGGGSAYLAPTGVTDGITTAGSSGGVLNADAVSAGASDPLYQAGIGTGGAPTAGGDGGNGQIVLEWNVSPPAPPAPVAAASAPTALKIVTRAQTMPVFCKLTVRTIGRCDVTLVYRNSKGSYVVGTGSVTSPQAHGTPNQLLTHVTLNATGHYLAYLGTVPAWVYAGITPYGSRTPITAVTRTAFGNYNLK